MKVYELAFDGKYDELAISFISHSEPLHFYAGEVQPVVGFVDFAVHCDGYNFSEDRYQHNIISPRTLAYLIRENENWDGCTPIRLLACSAGKYVQPGGAAWELVQELGVSVLAPIDRLFITEFGDLFVLDLPAEIEFEDIPDDDYRLDPNYQYDQWVMVPA